MADQLINGIRLHVEERGAGARTIVFSHGLLWSTRLFAAQLDAFSGDYRCVAYDHRGQGRSEVPRQGDEVSIETCYEDAVALIEKMELAPCHFVGLSMGGFVGMRIAARRPELLHSVSLIETAADPEPRKNVPKYAAMTLVARTLGVRPLLSRVLPIMFAKSYLADPAQRAVAAHEMLRNDRSMYKAVNGVIRRKSVEHEMANIALPTLILHGDEDVAIARPRALQLHELIAGSQFVTIPRAGHSSTMESPDAVNQALRNFLRSVDSQSSP